MNFWGHLGELRMRIFYSLIAVAVAAAVAYFFRERIYDVLIYPLLRAEPDIKLNYLAPTEPFFVYLRIVLFAGLVLASPVVLLQLWAFIAPALSKREKRVVLLSLPFIGMLFGLGIGFVYFFLLPISLGFLLGIAHTALEPELTQEKYFSFIVGLCLAGGLLFELPAVLGILGWLDMVNARWLWQRTGYALLILMILAAIITPTGDAFNMLALTAPLMVLYAVSIVVVWLIQRRARKST